MNRRCSHARLSQVVLAAMLACLGAEAAAEENVAWTNVDGVTIEAAFVRLDQDSVVLRMKGAEYTVPLGQLIESDRRKARELGGGVQVDPVDPFAESEASPEGVPFHLPSKSEPLRGYRQWFVRGVETTARFEKVVGQQVELKVGVRRIRLPYQELSIRDQDFLRYRLGEVGLADQLPDDPVGEARMKRALANGEQSRGEQGRGERRNELGAWRGEPSVAPLAGVGGTPPGVPVPADVIEGLFSGGEGAMSAEDEVDSQGFGASGGMAEKNAWGSRDVNPFSDADPEGATSLVGTAGDGGSGGGSGGRSVPGVLSPGRPEGESGASGERVARNGDSPSGVVGGANGRHDRPSLTGGASTDPDENRKKESFGRRTFPIAIGLVVFLLFAIKVALRLRLI